MEVIRDNPWPRIAAESAAIVGSILLAFWIDAWWDLRNQNEEARAYLQAIEAELNENREIIEKDLPSLGNWISDSRNFLENVIAPDASPSYEQVTYMVWRTGPDQTPPLLRAAVNDLISSGGLNVIESGELRREIAQYVRTLERDATALESVRDVFYRYVLEYHLRYGSFTEFDWEQFAEVPESPVGFELDTEAFAGNREYANLLISRILGFSMVRYTHREVLEQIDRVLVLIETTK